MHTHRKLIVDVAVFRKRHYARSHAQRRRRAGHDERISRAGDQQEDDLSEAGHQSDFTVEEDLVGRGWQLNCRFVARAAVSSINITTHVVYNCSSPSSYESESGS